MEHSQSAGRGVYTHDDAVCGGRSLSEDRDWRDDGENTKEQKVEGISSEKEVLQSGKIDPCKY